MTPDVIQNVMQSAEGGGMSPLLLTVCFVIGTLVSEDLTCIAAGLLVAHGEIGYVPAMLASLLGIYIGDILLYLGGRYLGARLLHVRALRRVLTPAKVQMSEDWFQRRGPIVILISRFVPGSRLPVYVASGMLRLPLQRVAVYFALAGVLWTPALVALAMFVGVRALDFLDDYGRVARWTAVLLALALWIAIRLVLPLFSFRGRRLLAGSFKRIRRWEFWPMWAFYPPVFVYIAWLALRHRSATLFTAANPAMPAGGVIGESKVAILGSLGHAGDCVARFAAIEADEGVARRVARFQAARAELGLSYPVVLKPDQGQRGEGVAIIRTDAQAEGYLARSAVKVLVQEYAPGREFGVFYYRRPNEARGRIFSVTEKKMPVLVGDGRRTLTELILRDDRAVCMAAWYLRQNRARLEAVIPAGEAVQLVELGTHCRGAIFLNGQWVVTPAFEAAIDAISRGFPGFYFGRFDIRTPSVEDMQQGRNFKIVELNGVTSEATHIYDPGNSLLYAYRVLMQQWRIAFEIGAQNRARGVVPMTLRELWRLYREFERAPEVE